MRKTLNISLPENMRAEVLREVANGGYGSTSEFFRGLLRMWKDRQIYNEVMESEADFRDGRSKKLTSLRDLR